MKDQDLPYVPSDVLQVSSAPLRAVIRAVTSRARRRGWWTHPLKGAATATEEMGPLDNLYWIHKSGHPVRHPEDGMKPEHQLACEPPDVSLPAGMEISSELSLSAAGDILRSRGIGSSRDLLYERVAHLLFDADISFANYESPVTRQPLVDEVIGDAGPPTECASPAQFDVLTGHMDRRFTILNTTNNHMFDMGVEGIETTQEMLEHRGITGIGTNRIPSEYGRGRVLTVNGIKLGFVTDCFGLNGHQLPERESYRLHVSKLLPKTGLSDLSLLKRQIDDCRAQGCDFIIASIHWGYEFEFFPRERQIEAARALAEHGADAVLCHHPHVIQPVETYRTRRDPDRVVVIAYSLGSLTWGFMAPHIVLSTILRLQLAKGRHNGDAKTYIAGAEMHPVFRTYRDGVTRIEPLARHVGPRSSWLPRSYVSQIRKYAMMVLGTDGLARRERPRDDTQRASFQRSATRAVVVYRYRWRVDSAGGTRSRLAG